MIPAIETCIAKTGAHRIDVRAAFDAHPEFYSGDGLHPNNAGAAVFAKVVADAIRGAPMTCDAAVDSDAVDSDATTTDASASVGASGCSTTAATHAAHHATPIALVAFAMAGRAKRAFLRRRNSRAKLP